MTESTVLETPKGPLDLHVCKDGSADNDDWISIYEISFPPDQRQDISMMKSNLKNGSLELDETRDQFGEILCMTLTEVFHKKPQAPAFLLACYTAVVPEFRGMGIGTVHRRKLAQLLQGEYKDYLGLFTEIESTTQPGLTPEESSTRTRRKRFFLKLGLVPIPIDYHFPSTTEQGQSLAGELLWLPFNDGHLPQEYLSEILMRIYTEGYGLDKGDPFIAQMLTKIT